MAPRVLIVSWEYPPIVEGGLGRNVRKLSEGLVREGVDDLGGHGLAGHRYVLGLGGGESLVDQFVDAGLLDVAERAQVGQQPPAPGGAES